MSCSIDDCPKPIHTRTVCVMHYTRARRGGWVDTLPRTQRGGGDCSVDGCDSAVFSNGFCQLHYGRVRRIGSTELPSRESTHDRLFNHVDETSGGCLQWQGHQAKNGYGVLSVENRIQYAHRLAYELAVGPIPAEMTIDHLCFNRMCINPNHLEVVTRAENNRRANRRRFHGRTAA